MDSGLHSVRGFPTHSSVGIGQPVTKYGGSSTISRVGRIDDAKAGAKHAANTARKAGLTISLILIGALIASVAALLGGNEQDEKEALLASGRLQ
ncbi:hypothetical protein [Mesorhizobium sp. ANAO-SY3R2]|uniref:hypothetical protein n=1 Tax=Mesorhizobium sp. ANAO-SY3R2 TaxID=3166644 RepID=UPI00366DA8C8